MSSPQVELFIFKLRVKARDRHISYLERELRGLAGTLRRTRDEIFRFKQPRTEVVEYADAPQPLTFASLIRRATIFCNNLSPYVGMASLCGLHITLTGRYRNLTLGSVFESCAVGGLSTFALVTVVGLLDPAWGGTPGPFGVAQRVFLAMINWI